MTNPEQAAALGVQAALEVQRALELFAPNASNVRIKTVDHNQREIQITDYRAELPDGSSVYAPRIIIRRG